MWLFEAKFENFITGSEMALPIQVDSMMCEGAKHIFKVAVDMAFEKQPKGFRLIELKFIAC